MKSAPVATDTFLAFYKGSFSVEKDCLLASIINIAQAMPDSDMIAVSAQDIQASATDNPRFSQDVL